MKAPCQLLSSVSRQTEIEVPNVLQHLRKKVLQDPALAAKMTAPDVLSDNHGNGSTLQAIERTDQQSRDLEGPQTCGFALCEFERLKDAVCGNGLALMESRDDETLGEISTVAGSNSFIDDKLKTFSQKFALAQTTLTSNKTPSGACTQGGNDPAMVSTLEGTKTSDTSSALSSNRQGVKTERYEKFMSAVNSTSKTYGAQSIHVADLYVSMGVECIQHGSNTRSIELALLLLEEAFCIYQAKAGDSHEQTIDCRIHLGKAHLSLKQYDEALECFCMAVYMREALAGSQISISEVWVLISSVHHANSKLELSLKASAKALTGYRSAYGDKHPQVISVLQTIAKIHIDMGNHDKAVDIEKYVRLHTPHMKAEF